MSERIYVWCTYRDWSFRILEGLLDLPGWRAGLVVTTPECKYDFDRITKKGIPILRVNPKTDLKEGGEAYHRILALRPDTVFHYGWSWLVPNALLALCPNVTLHPGKLPKDRGGSPIQNQIRNGETWTYANILLLEEALDAGPVFVKERISLEGEADDVWARMTASGCLATRAYLRGLADGTMKAVAQSNEPPTLYKRVKPEQSIITLGSELTARQIYDIVRAHNETDPNSYVVRASVPIGAHVLVVDRASLRVSRNGAAARTVILEAGKVLDGDTLHRLAADVANGSAAVAIVDRAGDKVFLDRFHVQAV